MGSLRQVPVGTCVAVCSVTLIALPPEVSFDCATNASEECLSDQVLSDQEALALHAWARLLRAHAAMTRSFNAELQAAHGLTVSDIEVLKVLSDAPDTRMRRVDLADRVRLTPSGITRLLDGLQAAGLVCKEGC